MKEPLVRIAADWDCSRVMRQTPGGRGVWDAIRFTPEPVAECDYLIMFNNRRLASLEVRCPRQHVWCVMQEPYISGLYDWMVEGHDNFAMVFTHHPLLVDPKYIASPPMLPWEVDLSYDALIGARVPVKTRGVSWIASKLSFLPGHKKRATLRAFLMAQRSSTVDIFGRGIRYIANKWDGLAPYRYSLAIENSSSRDYWTEKVADCFLSWTIPLYDGCINLEDYFPPDSFIRIDAADPAATLKKVQTLLVSDDWQRRLPALEESRRRVLNEYQLFPALAKAIRTLGTHTGKPVDVRLPSYRKTRWKHRARYLSRLIREGDYGGLASALTAKVRYLRWFGVRRIGP